MSSKTKLTSNQKLEALANKYYSNQIWNPKKGDYYTSSRNDLELYQIFNEDDKFFYTQYCSDDYGDNSEEWEKEKFLLDFGVNRVYVPNYIFDIEEQGQKEFDKGYAAAVANLINLHGDMVSARETFLQNFDSIEDVKKAGVSEFDLEILSKHF